MTYPAISWCTLQSTGTTPALSKVKDRFSPLGHVPRLCPAFLSLPIAVQKTLCCTVSLFRKSTAVPCWTTMMCGEKTSPFWSITGCSLGAGKVLPAMTSTYTTQGPFIHVTLPSMSPAHAALHKPAVSTTRENALHFIELFSLIELLLLAHVRVKIGRAHV